MLGREPRQHFNSWGATPRALPRERNSERHALDDIPAGFIIQLQFEISAFLRLLQEIIERRKP